MQTLDQQARPIPGYHPTTRWLHAALVLGVLFQLICAAQMAHPKHAEGEHGIATTHAETATTQHNGHVSPEATQPAHKKDAVGEWWMTAHRNTGVWVALIMLANLLWAIILRGSPRKRQIAVLFSAQHWSESKTILKHLPSMLIGKKPLPKPGNPLSLIVEMLGMLSMTAMAITGSIIWLLWAGIESTVSQSAEFWMEIHAGFAVLLLLYLSGHVSMALLHWRSGDPVFARIWPWHSR